MLCRSGGGCCFLLLPGRTGSADKMHELWLIPLKMKVFKLHVLRRISLSTDGDFTEAIQVQLPYKTGEIPGFEHFFAAVQHELLECFPVGNDDSSATFRPVNSSVILLVIQEKFQL